MVSQVNPHVVPFLRTADSTSRSRMAHRLVMFCIAEVHHRMRQIAEYGPWPKSLSWARDELSSVISGHVTIVPHLSLVSFTKIFSNPSQASLQWCMKRGEKSTFPHISCIQTRCSIEIALHQCLAHIREGSGRTSGTPT